MTGTLFLGGCLEQNLFPASSSAFHTQRSAVKDEMWPSVFLFTLHKKLMLNEISSFQLKREKTQFNVIYWFSWNIYLIGIYKTFKLFCLIKQLSLDFISERFFSFAV